MLAFEVSEKEVSDLHQRTKEGLITAKLNGKTLGHRKGVPLITRQSIEDKKIILKHSKDFGGTLSDVDCMRLCKCCKKTFYKYKKEIQSSK